MKRIDMALLLLQDNDLLNEHMEWCFYILGDELKELKYFIWVNWSFHASTIPCNTNIDRDKIVKELNK